MEIKEKVAEKLDDIEMKQLWEEICNKFMEDGEDGIKATIENKAKNIKNEFDKIQSEIKKWR